MSSIAKELIILCQEFVDNHPFEEEGDQGYCFDGQEFMEEVPEEDIVEFFSEMYNILSEK